MSDVSARCPRDLIDQAEAVFRTRDPRYRMRQQPIELTIEGVTHIVPGGDASSGSYDVFVRHGVLVGRPGTDESISIERKGVYPETAAHTSAKLLDEERLQMSR